MERSNPTETVVPTYDDLVRLLERANGISNEYRELMLQHRTEAAEAAARTRIAEERLNYLVLETLSLRTALYLWSKNCPCNCPACKRLVKEASHGE